MSGDGLVSFAFVLWAVGTFGVIGNGIRLGTAGGPVYRFDTFCFGIIAAGIAVFIAGLLA